MTTGGAESTKTLEASEPARPSERSSAPDEIAHIAVIGRMRWRSIRNHIDHIRKDAFTRTFVVVFGLLNIFGLGLALAYKCFEFIESFEAFGVALNSKIVSLLFLTLLVLILLSTVIVTYTTAFIAKETTYFFQLPLTPRTILWTKLSEAIAFSSWATVFLGLPVLIAFGILRSAPPTYYVQTTGLLLVFIGFAGLAGAGVTFCVAPLVRRLTGRQLLSVGALVFFGICYLFVRTFRFVDLESTNHLLIIDRFTSNLSILHSPYSPAHWASAGINAALTSNHREWLFYAALLLANTLIFVPVVSWYGARFYGRQWLESAHAPVASAGSEARRRRPLLRRITDRTLGAGSTTGLLTKDVLSFLRDPAQLSQSLLFLLLMAIYSLSLTRIPRVLTTGSTERLLFFANLAAICMILSSFTSRFLFPLISLEGRAFWVVGLAPARRSRLVYQKAVFGFLTTITLGVPMAIASQLALSFPLENIVTGLLIVVLASVCLSALTAGLGAAYPNFDEDNPARIAVGLGGTLNFFASALVVATLIGFEALPYVGGDGIATSSERWLAHGAALLVTALLSLAALRVGAANLERSEF